jgi:N-acetylmuramoyl-L-alanine amidase
MKINFIGYIAGMCLFLGMGIYVWRYQLPKLYSDPVNIAHRNHSSQTVTISCWSQGQYKNEQKTLLWSSSACEGIAQLIQAWLSFMDEEEQLAHPCFLQAVSISSSGGEAFISFDRSPLSSSWSTYNSLMTLESLLKTLRDNGIKIGSYRFLENHQSLQDNHLDFSKSWPLEGFLEQSEQPISSKYDTPHKPCIIVIDPAGDATTVGRIIDDSFERGITLSYAQALQKALQQELPKATITVARLPGEQVEPLRNAILANRLGADLYISVNFYAEKEHSPHCFIAYNRWHPLQDSITSKPSLSFVPYYEAYKFSIQRSSLAAYFLQNILTQQNNSGYIYKVAGIPCKNLAGVTVPALNIEIGISNKDDWKNVTKPIAHALIPVIANLVAMKEN